MAIEPGDESCSCTHRPLQHVVDPAQHPQSFVAAPPRQATADRVVEGGDVGHQLVDVQVAQALSDDVEGCKDLFNTGQWVRHHRDIDSGGRNLNARGSAVIVEGVVICLVTAAEAFDGPGVALHAQGVSAPSPLCTVRQTRVTPASAAPTTSTAATIAADAANAVVGKLVHLDAFDDSYERHEPTPLGVARTADKLLDRIAPMRTHERVISDVGGSFFGIGVGITISQLDLVRKNTHGVEIIQVVNADGSANVETVLGRLGLGHNHRIELQGPALNTSVTPGELPLGARFVGVGLTSDITSAMDHDAVSYTVEVKLTERSVLELAALGGAGAAALAADVLEGVVGVGVAAVVADAVLASVPVLSALLAVTSARRAWHVLHDPTASREMKAFAVAHTLGDTVRVFAPFLGTLMNAGLVGIAALCGWVHLRHTRHAAPIGPTDGGTPPTPPAISAP